MQLSKSDYLLYLKHPAWLWLKKNDKDKLPPIDDNTQAIFDAGHMFEAYAEALFPGGVTIGFNNYSEYLSLPYRTQKALNDGAKTIFQGRFEYEQITFICDIITVIEDKIIDLYEIKSSTKAKPEHEFDLAFQMVVLEGCGYEVRNIKVIHVNNQYVRHGEVNPKDITGFTDVTDSVKVKREYTKENINAALSIVGLGTCPDLSPSLASQDSFSDWLQLFKHLNNVGDYSIYDLCLLNANTVSELEREGIKRLVEVPANFSLKPKQQMQLEVTKTDTPIIKIEAIKDFLDSFKFPLYFLDYETLASTVPYFDGLKPKKAQGQLKLRNNKEIKRSRKHIDICCRSIKIPN